jgi:carbonic anhydrase
MLTKAGMCHDGDYDLVSIAGAGKDLLSENSAERDFILKQISISKKLHDIKTVYVLMHDNCGAYGISDVTEEHGVQANDLREIKRALSTAVQGVEVKGFIVKGVPTGMLSIEPVE